MKVFFTAVFAACVLIAAVFLLFAEGWASALVFALFAGLLYGAFALLGDVALALGRAVDRVLRGP